MVGATPTQQHRTGGWHVAFVCVHSVRPTLIGDVLIGLLGFGGSLLGALCLLQLQLLCCQWHLLLHLQRINDPSWTRITLKTHLDTHRTKYNG